MATVNADPDLLPNTKLRGLALLEGSSDSGFMQAVDYAHMVEGSCVSFGVQKGANQNIMGPVPHRSATNEFVFSGGEEELTCMHVRELFHPCCPDTTTDRDLWCKSERFEGCRAFFRPCGGCRGAKHEPRSRRAPMRKWFV